MDDVVVEAPDSEQQMTAAPRDGLERSVPFEMTRANEVDDGFNLEGYAAVFDSPTTIDSWEGRFTEQIARGAFEKTLRAYTPTLLFDHGKHDLIGSMPIGVIRSAREDNRGLFIRARLIDSWLFDPVRKAIEAKAITGWSFRFNTIRDTWDRPRTADDLPLRTLNEISVRELGPVVFPAYRETSMAIRSEDIPEEIARALLTQLNSTPEGAAIPPEPAVTTPCVRTLVQRRALAIAHGVQL